MPVMHYPLMCHNSSFDRDFFSDIRYFDISMWYCDLKCSESIPLDVWFEQNVYLWITCNGRLPKICGHLSEFQIQDEHPMCQNRGLDEHAALQPAMSARKLPNEVSDSQDREDIKLFTKQVLHVPWTVLASIELRRWGWQGKDCRICLGQGHVCITSLYKYIFLLRKIHFFDLDKYIYQAEQIHLYIWTHFFTLKMEEEAEDDPHGHITSLAVKRSHRLPLEI